MSSERFGAGDLIGGKAPSRSGYVELFSFNFLQPNRGGVMSIFLSVRWPDKGATSTSTIFKEMSCTSLDDALTCVRNHEGAKVKVFDPKRGHHEAELGNDGRLPGCLAGVKRQEAARHRDGRLTRGAR